MIRKVTFSNTKPAVSSQFNAGILSPEKTRSPLPAAARAAGAAQGKIQMRKVVTVKQPKTIMSSSPTPPEAAAQDQTSLLPKAQFDMPVISISAPDDEQQESVTQCSILAEPAGFVEVDTGPTDNAEQPTELPATDPDILISSESNVRRTSRTRKSHTDVFGTIAPPSTKASRRKAAAGPEFGAFAGMSALALKSLTASNTLRNQQQVVEVHTEVVRMGSKRPDSPTTKVRTVLERQKEERVLDRQRRAERRAQRTSGGETGETETGSSDGESESGESNTEVSSGAPPRHRRGPGEDEDYETPPRLERPLKRGRFEDGEAHLVSDKRVKWDRGLSTTVYLDDSPPKPSRSQQDINQRGCLTPAAKVTDSHATFTVTELKYTLQTMRLDTMGNVLNATTPLADLVHENIIVKKFVYLDDPEPDPPPDPAVRSTRSKSKKAKS